MNLLHRRPLKPMGCMRPAGWAALSYSLGQGLATFFKKEPFCFIFQQIWPVKICKMLIPF